jgi:hypothetical protein
MIDPTHIVFQVDPNWFESYWYGPSAGGRLHRFGVIVWRMVAGVRTLRTTTFGARPRSNAVPSAART